jgi:hypothetical protein
MGSAALICVLLYAAIASENREAYRSKPVTYNHYNLLVEGFLSGHLYMNLAPDPEKEKHGRDPLRYSPREHDASLYKGRYYLYFGVAPAVVLFLPLKALGWELPQYWAGAIFASAGYLFTVALFCRVKRDFFPRLPARVLFASGLVLGVVNWWPMLLSRVGIWEVCVSSAYAFSCASLFCAYGAMEGGRKRGWLAAASLCAGLAIASRPNYFFGAAILGVPLLYLWRAERAAPAGARAWLGRLGAAFLPIAGVGALLALYNYERFGNPLEFGTTYQILLRPTASSLFSAGYVGFNTYLYYLAPAHFSPWFPFFNLSLMPELPKGYAGEPEDMYGVVANMPVLLAAVFGLGLLRMRGGWSRLGALAAAAALLLLTVGGPLVFYVGANNRYIPDAICGLPVLAVLGIWVVEDRFRGGGVRGSAATAAWELLAAYSVAFGLCAGVQRDEIFRRIHPRMYGALAHALDYPSYWYDRIFDVRYGPLKLDLTFPANKPGENEPLVVTGWGPWSNVVYVRYCDRDHLQIGFIGPFTVTRSEVFEIDYAKAHAVTLSMGSLYPPRDSPYFDSLSEADADALAGTFLVAVDGKTRFRFHTTFFDAAARRPEFGRGPSVLDKRWTFTGTMSGG